MAKLTVETVEAGMKEKSGNLAAVARALGCARQSVWAFVQKHDRLKELAHDLLEAMKDNAESSLHAAILRGEPWAICFFLKCRARDRGYVERQEVVPVEKPEPEQPVREIVVATREEAATLLPLLGQAGGLPERN
jgi:hypothetical protein